MADYNRFTAGICLENGGASVAVDTYTMLAYASFVYCGFALRQALHEIVQIINVQGIAELRFFDGRLIVVDALLDLRLLACQFLLLFQLHTDLAECASTASLVIDTNVSSASDYGTLTNWSYDRAALFSTAVLRVRFSCA